MRLVVLKGKCLSEAWTFDDWGTPFAWQNDIFED